nr:ABC transporter permease [Pseudohalocynthiibacter aestuariivivens]
MTSDTATPAASGSRPSRDPLLTFKAPISTSLSLGLGVLAWATFFAIWEGAVLLELGNPILFPGPGQVLSALYELLTERGLLWDIWVSVLRVMVSFGGACLVAIPLGILMGSFRAVEAFFNPVVSAWRYLPAPAFIPLLLMWFGASEEQKFALLFLGVIWFLVTLIMDHTREISADLINTGITLGGNRWQILWTVVIPASLPGIVTAMRQMLAVSWTYLVIAEIVAADNGIGAMMMRAKRFVHVDEIMAGIVVIGVLGLTFDFALRQARKLLFPYLDDED